MVQVVGTGHEDLARRLEVRGAAHGVLVGLIDQRRHTGCFRCRAARAAPLVPGVVAVAGEPAATDVVVVDSGHVQRRVAGPPCTRRYHVRVGPPQRIGAAAGEGLHLAVVDLVGRQRAAEDVGRTILGAGAHADGGVTLRRVDGAEAVPAVARGGEEGGVRQVGLIVVGDQARLPVPAVVVHGAVAVGHAGDVDELVAAVGLAVDAVGQEGVAVVEALHPIDHVVVGAQSDDVRARGRALHRPFVSVLEPGQVLAHVIGVEEARPVLRVVLHLLAVRREVAGDVAARGRRRGAQRAVIVTGHVIGAKHEGHQLAVEGDRRHTRRAKAGIEIVHPRNRPLPVGDEVGHATGDVGDAVLARGCPLGRVVVLGQDERASTQCGRADRSLPAPVPGGSQPPPPIGYVLRARHHHRVGVDVGAEILVEHRVGRPQHRRVVDRVEPEVEVQVGDDGVIDAGCRAVHQDEGHPVTKA